MRKKIFLRFLSAIFAFSGLAILFSTLYPILSFSVPDSGDFSKYISPIPEEDLSQKPVDYTDPNNWFEGLDTHVDKSKVGFYNLSIPKLHIEDAVVAIGGENLEDNLIQYPGTALPGKIGDSVIFGHSILPQFYNPKSYLAIFSTLNTLRKGDDIDVRYDGVSYRYKVDRMFEVLPTDLEILSQNENNSYLSLVTCTPPGNPLRPRRLIVKAKLVPFDS